MKKSLLMKLTAVLLVFSLETFPQDPDFHIYLCFGQSNMEGQGTIEAQDRSADSRFRVMATVNCSNLGRTQGEWYTATPPLFRCYTGLGPVDYFGRAMVENLPADISVGMVNVAVAGCKIELFDKDNYQTYASTVESWMKSIISEYGGNPYSRLIEMAQLAQQDGVIKGILLHQGESNTGDSQWPAKVKIVYENILSDLGLDAHSVPLLAGEVVDAQQQGMCAYHNQIIARLPQTIPNAHVITSSGLSDGGDNLHFSSESYRELGRRYAIKMLSLLQSSSSPVTAAPITLNKRKLFIHTQSSGDFQIKTEGYFNYRITDMRGSLIRSGNATGELMTGADLSPGIYMLSIKKKGEDITRKILKR